MSNPTEPWWRRGLFAAGAPERAARLSPGQRPIVRPDFPNGRAGHLAWGGGRSREAGTAAGRGVGRWISALSGTGPAREAALTRLHGLLVRVAAGELRAAGHAGD